MRDRHKTNKTSTAVVACSGVCLILIILFLLIGSNSNNHEIGNENYPLIVLYHGKPEEAPYEWNTGVWTGWGER